MMNIGMGQTYGSSTTGYSFYRLADYVSNYFGTNSSDNEIIRDNHRKFYEYAMDAAISVVQDGSYHRNTWNWECYI